MWIVPQGVTLKRTPPLPACTYAPDLPTPFLPASHLVLGRWGSSGVRAISARSRGLSPACDSANDYSDRANVRRPLCPRRSTCLPFFLFNGFLVVSLVFVFFLFHSFIFIFLFYFLLGFFVSILYISLHFFLSSLLLFLFLSLFSLIFTFFSFLSSILSFQVLLFLYMFRNIHSGIKAKQK